MGEPMTEAEARERLDHILHACQRGDGVWPCGNAILATTDALAVLLDPETMLRAWEKAGRAHRVRDLTGDDWGTSQIGRPVWSIDDEGGER